jgi:acyl carrier protein
MRDDKTDRAPATSLQSEDEIIDWLVRRLAETAGIPEEEVDIDEPLVNLGLSSRDAVTLSGELSDWIERDLPPTLMWEFPTVASLARYLLSLRGGIL